MLSLRLYLLLEFLIRVVNAELFKRVLFKVFKAKDIQDAHVLGATPLVADEIVHLAHQPVEELGVQRLCQSVTTVRSLRE